MPKGDSDVILGDMYVIARVHWREQQRPVLRRQEHAARHTGRCVDGGHRLQRVEGAPRRGDVARAQLLSFNACRRRHAQRGHGVGVEAARRLAGVRAHVSVLDLLRAAALLCVLLGVVRLEVQLVTESACPGFSWSGLSCGGSYGAWPRRESRRSAPPKPRPSVGSGSTAVGAATRSAAST